jgi:hypothetical protein
MFWQWNKTPSSIIKPSYKMRAFFVVENEGIDINGLMDMV